MNSAGKPVSPTVHPRTKPEASDFAVKNRATNDWFRHDGKNIEAQLPPPQRLQGYVAPDIAQKAKGRWLLVSRVPTCILQAVHTLTRTNVQVAQSSSRDA